MLSIFFPIFIKLKILGEVVFNSKTQIDFDVNCPTEKYKLAELLKPFRVPFKDQFAIF